MFRDIVNVVTHNPYPLNSLTKQSTIIIVFLVLCIMHFAREKEGQYRGYFCGVRYQIDADFIFLELATSTGGCARSLAMLGSAEEHTSLARALSQLSELCEKVEQVGFFPPPPPPPPYLNSCS